MDDVRCFACRGKGCDDCRGNGCWTITGCPRLEISEPVAELCRLADLAEVALPASGGVLDQADTFVEGLHYLRVFESRVAAERDKHIAATTRRTKASE